QRASVAIQEFLFYCGRQFRQTADHQAPAWVEIERSAETLNGFDQVGDRQAIGLHSVFESSTSHWLKARKAIRSNWRIRLIAFAGMSLTPGGDKIKFSATVSRLRITAIVNTYYG